MSMNNIQQRVPGTQKARHGTQIKMIEIGKTRLRVSIRPGSGKGVPVLLMNGIGANFELLDPFIDELDPDLEILCFDVPGVGGSPPSLIPLSIMSLARLTAQALDYLGYQKVDVLGFSWGGALAQQFAYQHSDRCRRLILVATSAGAFMVPGHLSVLTRMMNPERYLRPAYMMAVAPSIYGGRFRTDPSLVPKLLLNKMRAPTGMGYYWQLLGSIGWTSIHWLCFLQQPALIITGDDDPLIPVINGRLLARLIAKSKLHIVPGGHLFILTDAQEAADLVQQFLADDSV